MITRPLVHARQPVRGRDLGSAPRGLERREVALGGVDEMADYVLDTPAFAGGRGVPRTRPSRQFEQPVRLVADNAENGVLALIRRRVPLAHCRAPLSG